MKSALLTVDAFCRNGVNVAAPRAVGQDRQKPLSHLLSLTIVGQQRKILRTPPTFSKKF